MENTSNGLGPITIDQLKAGQGHTKGWGRAPQHSSGRRGGFAVTLYEAAIDPATACYIPLDCEWNELRLLDDEKKAVDMPYLGPNAAHFTYDLRFALPEKGIDPADLTSFLESCRGSIPDWLETEIKKGECPLFCLDRSSVGEDYFTVPDYEIVGILKRASTLIHAHPGMHKIGGILGAVEKNANGILTVPRAFAWLEKDRHSGKRRLLVVTFVDFYDCFAQLVRMLRRGMTDHLAENPIFHEGSMRVRCPKCNNHGHLHYERTENERLRVRCTASVEGVRCTHVAESFLSADAEQAARTAKKQAAETESAPPNAVLKVGDLCPHCKQPMSWKGSKKKGGVICKNQNCSGKKTQGAPAKVSDGEAQAPNGATQTETRLGDSEEAPGAAS